MMSDKERKQFLHIYLKNGRYTDPFPLKIDNCFNKPTDIFKNGHEPNV